MKQNFFTLSALMLAIVACGFFTPVVPTPSTSVQTATPTPVPIPTNTPITTGSTVVLNNVTISIPKGLANDALLDMVSAATDPNTPPWDLAPAHLEFTLTGYQLQNRFHQPKIYVYPANEYAQAMPTVTEQIKRIQNILAGSPLSKETMPNVPFFNAGPLIASNMQVLGFQSGGGVRMLTEYAQYPATINNYELFYHFEGLTSDGKYYIVAIMPVTAPILAEDDKPDATIPPGGVPITADTGPDDAYYASVTEKLNSIPPDAFTPSLTVLDALIRSIIVTVP